ncbi:MAG: response regulator transcription factor [Saprospiraceae bacterium]|nr:response regulator transcription factor [Saprospiraceae bacterium]MBK9720816.1 response regulator transcription factor [Saprospiraceae bacterium]
MITAIIVEDERLSAELLQNMLKDHCPEVTILCIANEVKEAIQLITEKKPDLIFLDIEMQTGTGFDVLQGVKNIPLKIIFTTAYDHYALKAIKFSAIDYLLKPIDILELKEAVQKVITDKISKSENKLDWLLKNLASQKNDDYSISLSTLDGIEFVPIVNIIRLEANGPYTHFYLKNNQKLMISKNLKEYEMMLTDYGFFRIHNSHLINLKEVKKIIKTDGGSAVMSDDSHVSISPRKKDEFMTLIQQKVL